MRVDVAIIGLGPVGATLANLLGDLGVPTLVIERAPDIHPLPRAVHFDDEIMRVFQTIGVAQQVQDVSRVNPGMRFVDAQGQLLLDWPRPRDIGPNGWRPSYRFHQPDLEAILRKRLGAWPHVKTIVGADVTEITPMADGVALTVPDHPAIHAKYVVGCDGARSLTRNFIGGEARDLGFQEPWLVVDAVLKRPRPDLGDSTIQYCDPTGPATYVRGPGDRRRWEIALAGNPDPEAELDQDRLWHRLSRWITPEDADLERSAIYTFRSLLAGRWRKDRVLIAGDAAHQMPPFMGQGLCAGVRDAANLAWKLKAVLNGTRQDLLDTYQIEREPHVEIFIQGAVNLGRLINASDTKAALRDGMVQADGSVRMSTPTPRLGVGPLSPDAEMSGTLHPQPVIDGQRLDDLAGQRWVLIRLPDSNFDHVVCSANLDLVHMVADPDTGAMLQQNRRQAVLIRPDRYVYGLVSDADELKRLLSDPALQSK